MKKLLIILLVTISTQAYSQVYTLRVIHVNGNVIDSLYSKNGGEDTLWRHDVNVYNVAYVAKQWAYFPFFQPIPAPTTLSGYGITDALTTAQVGAAYQPVGSYLTAASIAGKMNYTDSSAMLLPYRTGKISYTDSSAMLAAYRTGINSKQPLGSYLVAADIANKLNTNGSAASLTNFPTLNQNTSGTAAGLSAVLSYANGGISAAAATSATTGTITVNMTSSVVTCTPTGNMTLNASGGVAGQILTFSFTTSGVSSFTITFGTNFRKTGTLATGTTSARFFTVTFRCLDGTTWTEIARTAVQT